MLNVKPGISASEILKASLPTSRMQSSKQETTSTKKRDKTSKEQQPEASTTSKLLEAKRKREGAKQK
jgi:hypothetical protein